MISGDNLDTAKAIACDAGILTPAEFNTEASIETQRLYAMDANDFRELDLVGTDFSVILKERSHWIYPVETQRLEAELAFQKKIDKDTDQATNDPTLYVSPLFKR
mgnify:CR=1 FL=1